MGECDLTREGALARLLARVGAGWYQGQGPERFSAAKWLRRLPGESMMLLWRMVETPADHAPADMCGDLLEDLGGERDWVSFLRLKEEA